MKHYTGEEGKELLKMRIIFGVIYTLMVLAFIFLTALSIKDEVLNPTTGGIVISVALVCLIITNLCLLRLEQQVGFYKCKHCGNSYILTYKQINLSPHIGLTRYMKCPQCKKFSWQKKTLE